MLAALLVPADSVMVPPLSVDEDPTMTLRAPEAEDEPSALPEAITWPRSRAGRARGGARVHSDNYSPIS